MEDGGRGMFTDFRYRYSCVMIWVDDLDWTEVTVGIKAGIVVAAFGVVVKGEFGLGNREN